MKDKYLVISWSILLDSDYSETFASLLSDIGFEAFHEEDNKFNAYILSEMFDQEQLNYLLQQIDFNVDLNNYSVEVLENTNWNKTWESNFDPVIINDLLTIRAPFHLIETKTPYEIIIEPKMSFGTGHHETTSGMIELMSLLDFKNKTVLDMGSGTGILSVFAEQIGAKLVYAIDNDPVCYDNCIETISLNNSQNIDVIIGDSSNLDLIKANIILANINRNILLNDIKYYSKVLLDNGILLLSGFYKEDCGMIDDECVLNGLKKTKLIFKNNWAICSYKK